ncbi:MAG: N-acylglucosamine 2-epimerase [Clostridiales bacterium]|nr:N-acylglucosamine 2-epimerase [Clostridiales bacterium]
MYNDMIRHLNEIVLPFWKKLKDDKNGGYISYMGHDLSTDPGAERGCILNSRILWFFSQAVITLEDKSLLEYADHAYNALLSMLDDEFGGVFWSMNADGTVFDSTKHTYNQAFAIYALSTYYQASGKEQALDHARALFDLIEDKFTDEVSYVDAAARDFSPVDNGKLSENGVMADKTMNTLLHLLEAYTELYRVSGDEEVRQRIYFIFNILEKKIYNPKKHRLDVFFDKDYNSIIDMHSYGHDIETSWLADRTLEILGDDMLTARIRPILQDLAAETYRVAYTENGFYNECVRGKVDKKRIWWVQAEALVGFLNAYEKTSDVKYLEASRSLWKFIDEKITDRREGSEWFWQLEEDGETPSPYKPIVEPWKCPYHNGRMFFEVIGRKAGKEL